MDHTIFKFILTYYIASDVKKCCEKSGVPNACIGLCMEEGSLSSRNLPIGEFGACAKFKNYISKCKAADYDPDNYDDPDYVLPSESEGNGSIYKSQYSLNCQKN